MDSQLRMLKPQGAAEPPPLAVFRADARLRLWAVAACAGTAIVFTWLASGRALRPLAAGPLAALFLFLGPYLLATYTPHRTVRSTLSGHRLEVSTGLRG